VALRKVDQLIQTVHCQGWWEQSGLGRQPMNELQLSFWDGEILGQGHGIVGQFILNSFVQADNVTLVKKYIGAHQIDYPGTFDGEGTFQGFWKTHRLGGRWLISIESSNAPDTIIDI